MSTHDLLLSYAYGCTGSVSSPSLSSQALHDEVAQLVDHSLTRSRQY